MAKTTDLDGRTWLSYSISVWDDIRKTPEEAALKHPALFPVQLAERLIQIFSHTGNSVLDPFCGTGSTLLAAHKLGRTGFGVDISEAVGEYDVFSRKPGPGLPEYLQFIASRGLLLYCNHGLAEKGSILSVAYGPGC